MSPKEPSNSAEGVLVRIKSKLQNALGMSPNTLKLLVDKFVRENMQTSGTKTHYTRVNTYNEFTTDKMTIKVFFKFLRIIEIQQVEFKVRIKTKVGKEVEISEVVNMGRPSVPSATDTDSKTD